MIHRVSLRMLVLTRVVLFSEYIYIKQECIPVGCVAPASVPVSGWGWGGVYLGGGHLPGGLPGVYTPL